MTWTVDDIVVSGQTNAIVPCTGKGFAAVVSTGCYHSCMHSHSASRCMLILTCNRQMSPPLVHKVLAILTDELGINFKLRDSRWVGNMVNVYAKSIYDGLLIDEDLGS